jgi:hypothetical protein
MDNCCRLFHADNIKAFHLIAQPVLVVSAEVTLNPYADDVQICRNPLQLAPPAVREYTVVGSTRPGVHPELAVKRTITASFPMDSVPAKVAVYSMGIDNPVRQEISVGDPPGQTSTPVQPDAAPQTSTPAMSAPVEATGWSRNFVLQEALSSAVTELRAAAGFRNPDVGLHFQVVEMGGQVGGFTVNTGVFVKVKTG